MKKSIMLIAALCMTSVMTFAQKVIRVSTAFFSSGLVFFVWLLFYRSHRCLFLTPLFFPHTCVKRKMAGAQINI